MSAASLAVVTRLRRRRTRHLATSTALLGTAVALLFVAGVLLGSYTVTPADFIRILGGQHLPGASFIVLENKLPRALIALLSGAAFGTAGALFQAMLRNPLASPDIIGISYGASAAAVGAIVFLGASGVGVSLAAIAGALAAALLISLLARGRESGSLILMGIGVAAFLQAAVTYLIQRTDIRTAQEALLWLVGSLNSASWQRVVPLAAALLVLFPAAAAARKALAGLALGQDTAAGLGHRTGLSRFVLTVLGVLLAAVATAAAGPVAFVSFLSGPIALRLNRGRPSLLLAALVGAAVVLAADFAGANFFPTGAVPVGVVTGALGAPFLLWLLASSGNRRTPTLTGRLP